MKKSLAALLAAFLILLSLSACDNKKPQEPEPVTPPETVKYNLTGRWTAEIDVSDELKSAVKGTGEIYNYLLLEGVTIDVTLQFGPGDGFVSTYVLPDESVDRIREAFFSASKDYLTDKGEEFTDEELSESLSASINELTSGFTRISSGVYTAENGRLDITYSDTGTSAGYTISLCAGDTLVLIPDSGPYTDPMEFTKL